MRHSLMVVESLSTPNTTWLLLIWELKRQFSARHSSSPMSLYSSFILLTSGKKMSRNQPLRSSWVRFQAFLLNLTEILNSFSSLRPKIRSLYALRICLTYLTQLPPKLQPSTLLAMPQLFIRTWMTAWLLPAWLSRKEPLETIRISKKWRQTSSSGCLRTVRTLA